MAEMKMPKATRELADLRRCLAPEMRAGAAYAHSRKTLDMLAAEEDGKA